VQALGQKAFVPQRDWAVGMATDGEIQPDVQERMSATN
jgi:hypothetical protein